jgi:hypothetical protein
LNSYSYAEDNPITGKDPSGKLTVAQINTALQGIISQLQGIVNSLQQAVSSGAGYAGGAISQAAGAAKTQVGNGLNALNNGLSTVSTYINSNPYIGVGLFFLTAGEAGEGSGMAGEGAAADSLAGEAAITTENGEPLFRGGSTFESGLRVDANGKITSGYSLNVNPNSPNVVNNGGANALQGELPPGLKVVQQGSAGHYQILPVNPTMPVNEYQNLVNQIKLTPNE